MGPWDDGTYCGDVDRCCNVEGGLLWWEELWGGAALGLIHTQPPI